MVHRVSLVITTYNWPEALAAVFDTVATQSYIPHEVVVADDGSKDATRKMIEHYRRNFPCPIVHAWHEDNGYQVAKIRNKAVSMVTGDYVIFIDGDCLLRDGFIAAHVKLSRSKSFVWGNRVLLSPDYTDQVIAESIDVTKINPFRLNLKQVNRRWSLLPIPMGPLRFCKPKSWRGVKTCNMSLYTQDIIDANGFEENFEGWGYEDSDLIVRLLHRGLRRISGRFAVTVIHLWHHSNKSALEEDNWQRLQHTINTKRQRASLGVDQYL